MKKNIFISLLAVFSAISAMAQAKDLTLPGEKWIAKFDKYVCAAFGSAVEAPARLASMKLQFEQITTDSTLDNGLLKATFEENGKLCRYNAIVLADNAASTVQLVQSIAYDPAGGASAYLDCNQGKAVLDASLKANNYFYYGHPHNLAIMMPGVGAETVCAGSEFLGANFVVKGRLQ